VKRDLEVESDAVRVMTVHGAKGLEAPLVILADTTSVPDGRHERLLDLPDSEAFVWAGKKALDSAREEAARQAADESREAEYRRLLYVALTRAADALIVCGSKGTKKIDDGCWYRLVRDALEAGEEPDLIKTDVPYADAGVMRWRPQEIGKVEKIEISPAASPNAAPWLAQAAPSAPPAPMRVTPSRVEPQDQPVSPYLVGQISSLDPRLRGDLLHRLLQRLPEVDPAKRQDSALKFLAGAAAEISEAEREKLVAEALRVIDHPDLRELFGPGSRAEVDLLANFDKGRPAEISGRIDRLAVFEDQVIIADFKTGRPPDDGAEPARNYLEQLAVYRAVLARIYANRAMRCMLVWTENAVIQEIAADRLETASRGLFPAT
jgi:ATP-dependent helicase/nuclease subunit A